MNTHRKGARRRSVALLAVAGVVAAMAAADILLTGVAARADTPTGPGPVMQPPPNSVTADALPTVQIDGVAWAQVVTGNTVYVGGSFANARPAGAAPGVNTSPRANILAYDITTGNLLPFAPVLNAQVRALALSPDGTRLYAAGDFTTVNGQVHNRIAAFSTATGALLTTFNAGTDAGVHSVTATNTTVYVGGLFQNANGVARAYLAAFSAVDGSLTAWAPTADGTVEAMTLSPDGGRLIIGGRFANVNGASWYGMASLDAATGANLPWAVVSLVKDAGPNSAILHLSTDGTSIFGSGYVFGSGGNFEGTFSADPTTGNLNWMEDCHGDTYGNFVANGVVYTIGHQHYCGNDNGWPVWPTWQYRRSVAFSVNATGVLSPNGQVNYPSYAGQPSPSIVNWFPDYTTGTYTGQNQAAWTVSGNASYVVEGGEFPTVNGAAQQGLVRFAVRPIAPAKSGPMVTGAHFMPSVNSFAPGTAHLSFQANWDRDSKTLSYQLVRNSDRTHPIWTGNVDSEWWNRPQVSVTDTGLTPGTTYWYRLYVTDPDGNQVAGDTIYYTERSSPGLTSYDQQVIADGATAYWPLDESTGSVAYDNANGNDADLTGVTRGTPGPVAPETGTTFGGTSSSYMSTRTPLIGPSVFTISAWVNTTTARGGKIIGFGSWQYGASQLYDRQLYLDNAGRVNFGVKTATGSANTVTSTFSINDGTWHQVVGQLSAAGMTLYIDGLRVARRTDTNTGLAYLGWWRIGGDSLGGWTNTPSSGYLAGSIADVAIFPTALTDAQIQSEFLASGRTLPTAAAPSDSYGQVVYGDDPDIFWRLDETSGAQAVDASRTNTPGAYSGNYALNQPSPVTVIGKAVYFNGSNASIGSYKTYVDPTVYSEESWFKTTTTAGGKIMGFGSSKSGLSSNYDRHVYMLTSGQLVFGVYAGSQVTITSMNRYNDGKWHQVVATQGPDGMTLYVDGLPVGYNPNTAAQNYTGYWRVGGDRSWSGANYFNGTIDEVAFYSTELTAARVLAHYKASPAEANVPPTASFTSVSTYLNASFDGTASFDPDGSITGYAWTFGDGVTGSGATPSHLYGAPGTYQVTLTVTDNEGATSTVSHSIAVTSPPANQNPLASFTESCVDTVCNFDAGASYDPDGTVVGYAWTFGDGGTATGVTPSHTFPTGGVYPVTLTVIDNSGGTGSTTQSLAVTSPSPQPVAAFTYAVSGLAVAFDGSGSSDPGGTIASYDWSFGDGSTGNGTNATHTYAAASTYLVNLTVTDNLGNTATTSQSVTITPVAADAFGRAITNGWGSADTGGPWALNGSSTLFSVANGHGSIKLASAGAGPSALLNSVSARDVNVVVDATFDSVPTGGGTYVFLIARHSGSTEYRLKAKVLSTSVTLYLTKLVSGSETTIASKTITMSYNLGDSLRLRFIATGTGTTSLTGKVWKVGSAEPTSPQLSATDTEATLQGSGAVGLQTYLSGSATTIPVTTSFTNYLVIGA